MASSTSFNDFSMHVAHEVDDDHSEQLHAPTAPHASHLPSAPPILSTSAPTTLGLASSSALKIPRSSLAHLLAQRSAEAGTPRSSLDVAPSSGTPTPRNSLSSPRSPTLAASAADEPASPRSPRTPGGRRKRAQKIDGMDYYEFCELIRSSSL
jgi:hypothetical protein